MGLPLKNFKKQKHLPLKISMKSLFTPEEFHLQYGFYPVSIPQFLAFTPEEFHHFYPLPLKNSTGPQPGGGGGSTSN